VLLTDGVDNASDLSQLEAVWTARRVDVPMYTLSFLPMPVDEASERVREGLRTLQTFANATGGAVFPVHEPHDLELALAEIQEDLRFQYVIGFYPAPVEWDGSFRPVTLVVTPERYRVRTRQGYYAEP
jgi:VWFA-related protein